MSRTFHGLDGYALSEAGSCALEFRVQDASKLTCNASQLTIEINQEPDGRQHFHQVFVLYIQFADNLCMIAHNTIRA